MVRANANEPSEDKKETTKRKATPKKKNAVTGVWPCKINGCNKQFAREADLKRHQRTTKLHSMPGFACPQCDATFTRTDALRRHQKSRHNGIVIEPAEQDKKNGVEDEAGVSSGSKSRSHSGTPSSKGKERATANTAPTALAQPNSGGPAGTHSSYYRQHTATTTNAFIPPRPPQPVMDAQYAQVGLPTSATRLNQATNWSHPHHPWPDGPPPMGPISYHQVPGPHTVFYTSPYYRPNGGMIPPHAQPQINPELTANGSSSHSPPQHNDASRTGTPMHNNGTNPEIDMSSATSHSPNGDAKPSYSVAPVIDPSLDSSTNSCPPSHRPLSADELEAISVEITQAAMEAVIESAKLHSSRAEAEKSATGTPNGVIIEGQDGGNGPQGGATSKRSGSLGEGEADADGEEADDEEERAIATQLVSEGKNNAMQHGYGPPLERPEPMEHMLTEDGEPMLNPAELLTQESLASPPPS